MKKHILFHLFFCSLLFSAGELFSAELKPFKSDMCSSFPSGTYDEPILWAHCCVIHDYEYWKGDGDHDARLQADAQLGVCVNEALGYEDLANPWSLGVLMTLGTRFGGTGVLPTSWRWGYGWDYDVCDRYDRVENVEVLVDRIHEAMDEYDDFETIGGQKLPSDRQEEVIHHIKWDLFLWESKLKKGEE